jgi:hypothetical protein
VPHVHDEDQAVAGSLLPHLVLKGVVKDKHLALFPFPGTEIGGGRGGERGC